MMKYALLAGAMLISAPAMAQDKPATPQTPPAAQPATQTDPAQPAPQAAAPAQSTTSPTAATDPAAPAQAAPATKAQQIAQVVDSEFATYDKDKDGVLSAIEFDAWMIALKTAADPSTKADAPATKAWLSQAFAQADTDKNKKVSKTELNGFLVAGNS